MSYPGNCPKIDGKGKERYAQLEGKKGTDREEGRRKEPSGTNGKGLWEGLQGEWMCIKLRRQKGWSENGREGQPKKENEGEKG
jgi:hypothetical protein